MLARVQSYLLHGIDAQPCEVEVDLDQAGLDRATVVGLPDVAVRESLERVRSALANAGYPFPMGRILINLAPADVRKEGPVYDLPIALGLLIAQGILNPRNAAIDIGNCMFAGELALDGRLRPVRGVIALASLAKSRDVRWVIVPHENAGEATVVGGIEVLGVRTLAEVVGLLQGDLEPAPIDGPTISELILRAEPSVDFVDVRGQEAVKRALVIAAAGTHNVLMLGPAGSGKTMMAKALPGILPKLTPDEAVQITRIYSAVGELPAGCALVTTRPVRTPHHTASPSAVVGGGTIPKPGEISLAHLGVLFLDELPEFQRSVLETLRQPMEDACVTIARVHSAVRYPARFMLVAAMNPTPRGDVAPGEIGRREMERYISKVSGPMLDRIDIHVEAPAVPWKALSSGPRGTSTSRMRELVERARDRQRRRQGDTPNSSLPGKTLDEVAPLDDASRFLLGQAITELGLSARAYDKIRRLARTIADLDEAETIADGHIAEAVGYRLLDRRQQPSG